MLVVDNGSRDGTARQVRRIAKDYPVPLRVVRTWRAGISRARMRALHATSGRVIVYLDDDMRCAPGWLAAHLRAFDEGDVVVTGGPIRPRLPEDAPDWLRELLPTEVGGPTGRYEFGDEDETITFDGWIATPFGGNMGLLRRPAKRVGFRPELGWRRGSRVPGEEPDFFRRFVPEGRRMVYVAHAWTEHLVQASHTTKAYFLRWQYGYGQSAARTFPPATPEAFATELRALAAEIVAWEDIAERAKAHGEAMHMRALRERERCRGQHDELTRMGPTKARRLAQEIAAVPQPPRPAPRDLWAS